MKLSAAAVLMSFASVACAAATPFEQEIEGSLFQNGKALAETEVKFTSSRQSDTCDAPGVEGRTDNEGKFKLRQMYQPSKSERFVVVIHPFRLCVKSQQTWQPIWQLTTGPAPKKVVLNCDIGSSAARSKCSVIWNGERAQ